MKWPFSRNGDKSSVPQEIQEYYQSEKRERTGVAWLLALGTLITTIALAIILFFGGRWLYRTVVDRDGNNSGQISEQAVQDGAPQTAPTKTDSTNADGSNNAESNADNGGTAEGTSTETNNDSDSSSQTRPSRTPNTGSLPNTGPDSDL